MNLEQDLVPSGGQEFDGVISERQGRGPFVGLRQRNPGEPALTHDERPLGLESRGRSVGYRPLRLQLPGVPGGFLPLG
jgi:hypothetical protein